MMPRSAYQVLVFDLPVLPTTELEAAARFRVRSLSPLHPDQYHVYLDVVRRHRGYTVLAFLVPGDRSGAPGTRPPRADFPARLPPSWPQDGVLARPAGAGMEYYLYRGGVLKAAPSPATTAQAAEETWAALTKDHPGVPLLNRSFDRLAPSLYPRFLSSLPRDRSWALATTLLAVGLLALVWGATQYLGHLEARNAVLQQWVDRHAAPQASPTVSQEQRWKELRLLTGVPLTGLLDRIAARWPSGVKIELLEVRENRLQIEAQAPQALKAVAALVQDPWFQELKVVRIRSAPGGGELVLLEGVIHDDL